MTAASRAARRLPIRPSKVRTPTPQTPLTPDESAQLDQERRANEWEWQRVIKPSPEFAHRGPFCECHLLSRDQRARGSLCDVCRPKQYTLQAEAEARGEDRFDPSKDFDTLLREDRARHPQRVWLSDVIDYRYAARYQFPMQGRCLLCDGVNILYLERPIVVAGQTVRELRSRTHPEVVLNVALMQHAHYTALRADTYGIDGNRYLLPRLCVCPCQHVWNEVANPHMFEHVYRCDLCGTTRTVDSSD